MLVPASPLNLAKPEQLRIIAVDLTDSAGRPLDGNADGKPGGDYVAVLTKKGVTISPAGTTSRIAPLQARAVDAVFAEGPIGSESVP